MPPRATWGAARRLSHRGMGRPALPAWPTSVDHVPDPAPCRRRGPGVRPGHRRRRTLDGRRNRHRVRAGRASPPALRGRAGTRLGFTKIPVAVAAADLRGDAGVPVERAPVGGGGRSNDAGGGRRTRCGSHRDGWSEAKWGPERPPLAHRAGQAAGGGSAGHRHRLRGQGAPPREPHHADRLPDQQLSPGRS